MRKYEKKNDNLTSSIAKLVKWLQLQNVSLTVLFLTEQPLEFQPPDPSASVKKMEPYFYLFIFLNVILIDRVKKNPDNLPFNVKSQKTHLDTKFACSLG